jgi:ligand-binding sensor domain-containing protein/two-component sensor histidine kinase
MCDIPTHLSANIQPPTSNIQLCVFRRILGHTTKTVLLKPSLLLTVLLIWLFPAIIAQRPMQFTRLAAEDGLSNNSVQCILQDKDGIMWIGTNGGLNRYDGATFYQYSIISRPALSNSVVTALMQDEKGLIWIGTESGLNILDPVVNTIRQVVHDATKRSSLPAGPVRSIQKVSNGDIWVTSDYWLVKFTGSGDFTTVSIDSNLVLEDMVMTAVSEHTSNEVWISYLDTATLLVKKTTNTQGHEYIGHVLLQTPDYAKIYRDDHNTTWGISCYGINRFNGHTGKFESWLKNDFVPDGPNLHIHTSHCSDGDGNIWQGNERGSLVKYDLLKKQVTDYSWLVSGINATLVYCTYKDNNNNIWVGTDNGIIKISNRSAVFSNIPFTVNGNELKNIRCRRIMTDRNQVMYAATENYGLLKKTRTARGGDTTIALSTFGATPITVFLHKKNSARLLLNGKYDIGYIYDMWYDNNHTIWLAGFGIGRYDTRTDSLEVFLVGGSEQAMTESVNQFSICFDGKLFWTAGEHNLYVFDPVMREMQPFKDNKGNMPFKEVPCWSLVKKGEWIWAGSSKGLYKVNTRTREVVRLAIHPVLEHGINDIAMESDSSCWISTAGGGVIHYNEYTGEVKQYTNREGLSNNTVCGLLRDTNNDLWISTYAGLSHFNRQTGQFTNFYTKDGLNTDEFNRKAFSKLPDGRMIFGGLNGYMIFNPAKAFRRDKPVNILLTKFSKIDKEGKTSDEIFGVRDMEKVVIAPRDKFFSFYFTLSDMYDPAGNRYFYQLQGVDDTWHALGNQHFVSFNGLSPGKYVLKIKGHVGKGSASVNEISVAIVVRQVFYKTGWFIMLVMLATAAIVYFVVRYRIKQVQKIQYLRTRIASDLHDEVGSSLVRITILADAVRREQAKENNNEQLGTIAGISRGAVSTMKDVIWSIDSRNDTMGGMIQYMQEHLHNMLIPANIDFELSHTGLDEYEKLDMNFRQNVYLTFKEAINNVVKHAGASRVEVGLKKENRLFTMQIKDDGKGVGERKNGSGQGLYNMKLRAERLKAELDIVSGKGTVIIMRVPMR